MEEEEAFRAEMAVSVGNREERKPVKRRAEGGQDKPSLPSKGQCCGDRHQGRWGCENPACEAPGGGCWGVGGERESVEGNVCWCVCVCLVCVCVCLVCVCVCVFGVCM